MNMIIGTGKIYLYANWVQSLKEKRMIVKSIINRVQNKFNVSIAEVGSLDVHKSIEIGVACVSNDTKYANSIIQNVINYIENNSDALVQNIEIEII